MDRPLSPITERSSFSSRRSTVHSLDLFPRNHPTPIREISYEFEREGNGDDDVEGDADSVYSQVSSGETVIAARATPVLPAYLDHSTYASTPGRMNLAQRASYPFPTGTPSSGGGRTPRATTPITPIFEGTPLLGGLLPPPRGKRDSGQSFSNDFITSSLPSGAAPPANNDQQRRRRAHVDAYPGGRTVINLDEDTDDEEDFDARSVATATTAGLAGLGAGEREGKEHTGKLEVETVQEALKGIMDQQDLQMRRFRESAPTPPRSRPNSFFYDAEHPTLHNIPTFTAQTEQSDMLSPTPVRVRTTSKLVKSPPVSRPASTPGTPKRSPMAMGVHGGDLSSTVDLGSAAITGQDPSAVRKELSIQDALDLRPPIIPATFGQAQPLLPTTPRSAPQSPISSILRSQTPPSSSKKRSSRIIPHVLFSLFSDASTSERKREASTIGDERTDSKLSGELQPSRPRTKSKLAKNKPTSGSKSAGSPRAETPISDGLPLGDRLSAGAEVEATVRLSGTFGVRDDGSEVSLPPRQYPESPQDLGPTGLGLRIRRWSTLEPDISDDIPSRQPIANPHGARHRSGSFDTSGTAKSFAPDRNRDLYTHDALISTDDLVPLGHGRANIDDLPPISERSHTGHTTSDGHAGLVTTATLNPRPESPHTPEAEVHTPEPDLGFSAVTPPYPLPKIHHEVETHPGDEVDQAEEGRYGFDAELWREEGGKTERPAIRQIAKAERQLEVHSPSAPSPSRRRLPMTPTHTPPHSIRRAPFLNITGATSTSPSPTHLQTPKRTDAVRSRSTSLSPSASNASTGLPPLPPSLRGLALAHTPPSDLPLLIASHLLSAHATSLMHHSTHAKEMGDEMFRLAQESLDWGRVLMSMASAPAQRLGVHDGLVPERKEGDGSGVDQDRGYEGMSSPVWAERVVAEDAYTRLPPRRGFTIQHHSPDLGTHYLQLPTLHPDPHPSPAGPTAAATSETSLVRHPSADPALDSTLARARRADRQRKSESLPPEWFQRVEHLGASGWNQIHQAEQVWREGMVEEGNRLRSESALGTRVAAENTVPEVRVRAESALSGNGGVPQPLGSSTGSGISRMAGGQKTSSTGRKLVKKPSKRTLPGSRSDRGEKDGEMTKGKGGSAQGDGAVQVNEEAAVIGAGLVEGTKSRWWRRK